MTHEVSYEHTVLSFFRAGCGINLYFPLSHEVPIVDGRSVLSEIIHVIKHGLQWKDALVNMDHTKLSTTALSAGVAWDF